MVVQNVILLGDRIIADASSYNETILDGVG